MNAFLLDTHYWLWFQMANARKLRPAGMQRLLELEQRRLLHLSDVSIWEVARLVASGHIPLPETIERFAAKAVAPGRLQLVPLSTRILIESTRLPGNIHRDPSDRLLVATAREHGLTLITRDSEILEYAKGGYLNVQTL